MLLSGQVSITETFFDIDFIAIQHSPSNVKGCTVLLGCGTSRLAHIKMTKIEEQCKDTQDNCTCVHACYLAYRVSRIILWLHADVIDLV